MHPDRLRRAPHRRLFAVLSLMAIVATSFRGAPSGAQQPLPEPPGPLAASGRSVTLLAAPGDADTYVPPRRGAPRPPDAPPPPAPAITFASGFPLEAKAAVQAAVSLWAEAVNIPTGTTILASYKSLGAGTLAGAGPKFVFRDFPNAPVAGTWYAGPLAEALSGQNLAGDDPDITIDINVRSDWYFGTDGNVPGGRYDLMSVVLHEMAHGLGFLGTMDVTGSIGGWGLGSPPRPDIYDRLAEDASGQKLLNLPNNSVTLGNALRSNQVYLSSPSTNRNQADRLRVYAPSSWNPGSSFAHLDESMYPAGTSNSLTTPFLNSAEAVHFIGPLALCLLEAMGWSTAENCTPPPLTEISGSTWPVNGVNPASGPAGTVVTAYGTGLPAARNFVLVTGLDGGVGRPCMWNTAVVNAALRRTSPLGFTGPTTGAVNRGPGRWQVCFREDTVSNTVTVAAPYTFTVL